jgi:uncharacterized membrane protein YeaQ/YmgE (transglycosylase-associated protein family)
LCQAGILIGFFFARPVPGRTRSSGKNYGGLIRPPNSEVLIMGFFGFLLLGLIAGAIAKLILPGKQAGGWFITLILGVVGALLGGFLGSLLFNAPLEDFFSIQTWLLAIVGSIIVLLIYGALTKRRN